MTCLRGIEPSQSIYLSDLYHTSLHGICSKTYNFDRSTCIKPINFYVPTGCLLMLSPFFFKARHVSSAGCEVISIFDLQSWCHNSSAEKLLA